MGIHLPLKLRLNCSPSRVSMVLLAVILGAAANVAPSGAAPSRTEPVAIAARTMSLNVNVNLHLVGHPEQVFHEQGSFSGSLSGSVSTRNTASSSSAGEGTFTLYPRGGSISGRGSTHGYIVGAIAYFSGTANITGGTGRWAHATGSNMHYSGTLNRQNLHITEHITGTIRY
jgi:hypothetical protein